jgi:hypothetical protein
MLNPFEDDIENQRDTSNFIPSSIHVSHKKNITTYCYVIVVLIYILDIFTCVLGSLNNNKTNGLNNSPLTIQYWLIIFSIYNICGSMMIYQFNTRTYKNKLYFIFYEFIKLIWIIIGFVILFEFNNLVNYNFILDYGLFYALLQIILIFFNLIYTCRLKNHNYYN